MGPFGTYLTAHPFCTTKTNKHDNTTNKERERESIACDSISLESSQAGVCRYIVADAPATAAG